MKALTPSGMVCAAVPLKLNLLVALELSVPRPLVSVKAPPRLKMPAPPVISISTTVAADAPVVMVRLPLTVIVPLVIVMSAPRFVGEAVLPMNALPATVTVPAFTFNVLMLLPTGRFMQSAAPQEEPAPAPMLSVEFAADMVSVFDCVVISTHD